MVAVDSCMAAAAAAVGTSCSAVVGAAFVAGVVGGDAAVAVAADQP